MAEPVEIFRSANLLVRHVSQAGLPQARLPQARRGTLVISFGPWRSKPALELEGFGERFLAEHGIDAIFVTCASNAWYQYAEMAAALAAIGAVGAAYRRRITYGSSMGAFAALAFSRALRATGVIAISPQYAIGADAPFETRWQAEAAGIAWRHTLAEGLSAEAGIVVLYDPLHLDRHHVALLARHRPITPFPLPFAGHPAGELLREVRLVSRIVLGLIRRPERLLAYQGLVRRVRGRSGVYWTERSRALAARGRLDQAMAAADRAVALAPGNQRFLQARGQMALRLGDMGRAVDSFARIAQRAPDQFDARLTLARALNRAGDLPAALREVEAALAITPAEPRALALREGLRARLGQAG